MKCDCFAMKETGSCRVLVPKYYVEYLKDGKCGNDGCPFYKPHGKTITYIRGLDDEDKARLLGL